MQLILSIDQGTTSSKALLVDTASGTVLAEGSAPVAIAYPQPGWVEQDALDIWQSVQAAAARALRGARPDQVAGIAISNQRESVVAWSASTGQPIGPVLGWQDSRTADWCSGLARHDGLINERTGLHLDAMFSAPKLRWLLHNAAERGLDLGDLRVGTIDSWLLYKLTGEHLIEAGNASRTLLFNTATLDWDEDLLDLFQVPRHVLPTVRPSVGPFAAALPDLGSQDSLSLGAIPVLAVLADSHAALFHHGQGAAGVGKATYGTGSSVMLPTTGRTRESTLAWVDATGAQYASEGNILTSGAGLDWLARTLGAPDDAIGGAYLTTLAAGARDSGGAAFVPAFTGLGAPHWDRAATGLLSGLTGATSRAQIARAGLEGVANQVTDVVEAVADSAPLGRLVADGGASASPLLMQIQADLLGRPVEVSPLPFASALGAADLAAVVLTGQPLPKSGTPTVFEPAITDSERRRARATWRQAVLRSRGHAI
ncbi:MAG: FGGY family carbohydrate kinase [Promicromonosporaceae bacterium]|nr:FGGY family carbohydrate kinase [Promicromonosporaceae bacterium]